MRDHIAAGPRVVIPATNRWGDAYAYSRAIRLAPNDSLILLSGIAPVADDGSCFAPGDAHAQTLRCYHIAERALAALGLATGPAPDGARAAILRSRMFVTDITRSHEFGLAHRAFFDNVTAHGSPHRPCLTMLGIAALIDPNMLVEIEIDAVAPTHEQAHQQAHQPPR